MKYPLNTFLAIVSMATLTHTAMAGPLMNSDLDRDGYDNYLDFDTDGDGLPDDFEKDNNFNFIGSRDGGRDADFDGFTNAEEYRAVTDMFDPADNPATKTGPALQKLFPQMGNNAEYLGSSLAISGDTLVTGATFGEFENGGGGAGNVHIYTRQPDGLWQQFQILYPERDASGKDFGQDVDLAGDTLLVGANHEDMGAEASGAAYVYTLVGGEWQEQAKLSHANADDYDYFGYQVAMVGDQALISCPYCLDARGAVYVYDRDGSNWTLSDVLTNCPVGDICTFGISVSVDGDRAVITAPYYSTAYPPGKAFVYERSNGVWQQTAELVSNMTLEPSYYGSRAVLSGDTIIVSDFWEEWTGSGHGNAYEFVLENGTWVEKSMFYAPDFGADCVGQGIALAGDKALITGRLESPYRGAVMVLERVDGVWTETDRVFSDSPSFNTDLFGWTAALDKTGEQGMAGAVWDRDTTDYGGAVYVMDLSQPE